MTKKKLAVLPAATAAATYAEPSGEISLTIAVTLTFVVGAGFSPGDRLDRAALKQSVAELVQSRIDAAGGVQPEDIETLSIIEVKDLDTDGGALFVAV